MKFLGKFVVGTLAGVGAAFLVREWMTRRCAAPEIVDEAAAGPCGCGCGCEGPSDCKETPASPEPASQQAAAPEQPAKIDPEIHVTEDGGHA
ncbi:MAG: hypothetical protein RR320_01675 [Oscillospiraceae bacterium]